MIDVPGGVRPGAGRPTLYSDELADEICERLAAGRSLLAICRDDDDMPDRSTVLRWQSARPDFAAKCVRAREFLADYEHDDMVEIERDVRSGALDPHAAKVILSSKQWRAAKLAPKKYGDKLEQTVQGPDGGPLVVTWLTPGSD